MDAVSRTMNTKEKMKQSFLTSVAPVLLAIIILVGVGYLLMKYNWTPMPVAYNASLEEFTWPEGPVLIHMHSVNDADETGINPGNYIISSDGKISTYLQATSFETLSPTELLIAGRTNVFDTSKKIETPFYYITPGEVRTINTVDDQLFDISLAPTKQYIKYTLDDKLCIATFDFVTLGECHDIKALIPDEWDWNTYFIDAEWNKEKNTYVVRIRNSQEHDLVASNRENTPAERVQKEVARYQYDAEKNTLEKIPLDSMIALKTKPDFQNTGNTNKQLTRQGYRVIYDQGGNSIGLEQVSTAKKAKLMDAPFFGDMPGFDVYFY